MLVPLAYQYLSKDNFLYQRYPLTSPRLINCMHQTRSNFLLLLLESSNQKISGINSGINDHGALIINNEKGSHKIYSGTLIQIGSEG